MIKNLKVSSKLLLLSLPAILALIALLLFFSTESVQIMNKTKNALYDEAFVSTAAIINADRDFYQALLAEKELFSNFNKLSTDEKDALIASFDENAQQVYDRVTSALDNAKNLDDELYSGYQHSDKQVTLATLREHFEAAYQEWLGAYDLKTNKGDLKARQDAFDSARDDINTMTELLEGYANKQSADIASEVKASINVTVGIVIVVIVVVLFFVIMIIRYLRNSIKYLTRINQAIAAGDLSVKIDEKRFSRDEIGQLTKATGQILGQLNQYTGYIEEVTKVLGSMSRGDMRVRLEKDYIGDFESIKVALYGIATALNDTLTHINDAAVQVNIGAEQVASASQALASGSTQQASSTEELAATISEVAKQVSENASNASKAKDLSKKATGEVVNGNRQMSEMIDAMQDINTSSNEINKIIKVIDDIAFQTNILALNAAVEAARAGDEGKGFAVVADEVRNLAAKSAEAAKTTASLIEASIAKVAEGTKLADSTARSLDEIVQSVEQTARLIDLIDVSSSHQAEAVFQISQGIDQISNVVQTNSATAEESAATSEELASQAAMLKTAVGNFKLQNTSVKH